MFFYNIDFSIPKKCDIIILDDEISNLEFNNFKVKIINRKKLNLFCLLKSFILLKINNKKNLSLAQFYKKNLYRMYAPKVAISHDANRRGAECKKLCPEIITIIYQFTYYHEYYKKLKKVEVGGNFDYLLIWSKHDKKYLNNFPKKKIILSGSVRNNSNLIKKRKIKHEIMLLGEFGKGSYKKI